MSKTPPHDDPRAASDPPSGIAGNARAFFFLAISIVAAIGFYDLQVFYGGYRLQYGVGIIATPSPELLFYLWVGFFGTVMTLSLVPVLLQTSLPESLQRLADRIYQRPLRIVVFGAIAAFGLSLLARWVVLLNAPITDDESTYLFIAHTLLQGGVTVPSPGDIAFFNNQFVFANAQHWFGKYPIGHPLLLAMGEAVGLRVIVVPLLAAFSFVLTYLLGRRLFSDQIALLGAGLLVLSPQFILTHATQLSQPTSGFFLLLGLWAAVRLRDTRRLSWALLSGFAWAMCILARPLPGVLFLPVIAAFAFRLPLPKAQKIRAFAVALLPVLVAIAGLLLINKHQNGSWTKTSYQQTYKPGQMQGKAPKPKQTRLSTDLSGARRSIVSSSWASALLRQLFWLLGSPLAWLFLLAAYAAPHRSHRADNFLLVSGSIGAVYLYRFLLPKTVVATTGPIYVAEAVPLLCLLLAAGYHAMATREHPLISSRTIVAFAAAIAITAAVLFLPFQLQQLQRCGLAWRRPMAKLHALQRQTRRKLLVFSNALTYAPKRDSWAYFPPNPHPSLKDDVLFVRRMIGPKGPQHNYDFWKKRFPTHLPVYIAFDAQGRVYLKTLSTRTDF